MSHPDVGTTAMDQATLSLRLAEVDKALADAAKARAENQRLLAALPHEIERINAEAALAKAEARKLDRELRWYPWLGASGVFALAITLLKLFGH